MNYCQKEEHLSKKVPRDLGDCCQYFLWCSRQYDNYTITERV